MAAMLERIAYCGAAPVPGMLAGRLNLDPILLTLLAALAAGHLRALRHEPEKRPRAIAGWAVTATALISPLCALSVALFAARVGQHMILLLAGAPLLALALPSRWHLGRSPWPPALGFLVTLWFWHMPAPYEATFGSPAIYWAMHVSLFGTALWLWRRLLDDGGPHRTAALAAGTVTSIQMGMLGAVLSLAARPLFRPHLFTTEAWGLSPLADQQLGGVLMWVPGCLLFLWVAVHGLLRAWSAMDARPA